jgi:hypothetical protein
METGEVEVAVGSTRVSSAVPGGGGADAGRAAPRLTGGGAPRRAGGEDRGPPLLGGRDEGASPCWIREAPPLQGSGASKAAAPDGCDAPASAPRARTRGGRHRRATPWRPLSYGPPWSHYLGGYQDRLLGGPLGLLGLCHMAPDGVGRKDYGGGVLE